MREIKAALEKINGRLDRALLVGQDFRTWRRGHEERHGRECADHAKRIAKVEKQAGNNRMDWRILLAGLAGGGGSVGVQKIVAVLSAALGWGG